jgi:hypothetical protein
VRSRCLRDFSLRFSFQHKSDLHQVDGRKAFHIAGHPSKKFFSPGDMTKSWAADAPNSPVMVANDPEECVTVLFILADKWSDGTAAPSNMP